MINDMAPYQAQAVTLTVGDEPSGEIAQAVAVQGEAPAEAEGKAPDEDPDKKLSNTWV